MAGAAESLVVLSRDQTRTLKKATSGAELTMRVRERGVRFKGGKRASIGHRVASAVYTVSTSVLKPQSKFIQAWKAALLLFCAWRVIYVPACVAFQWRSVLEYVIEFFFVADIGIKFMTGFTTSNGHTVLSLRRISYKYATTWFVLDTLGAVPCQIIEAMSGVSLPVSVFWLKLVPVFSAYATDLNSFQNHFWFLEQIQPCLGGLFVQIFGFFLLVHYATCAYWGIGYYSIAPKLWFPMNSQYYHSEEDEAKRLSYQYAEAFHAALAAMQGNQLRFGGDKGSTKIYQLQVFECIIGIVGVLGLSFVIGSVTTLISALGRKRTSKMEYMGRILEHMKSRNVSTCVRQKVCNFYDQLYDRVYDTSYETLFSDLPPHLDMLLRTGCKVGVMCDV
jgi:hypothetical protein